jgi:hypothetical protein
MITKNSDCHPAPTPRQSEESSPIKGIDNIVLALKRIQKAILWDIMKERSEKEVQKKINVYF